MNRQELLDGIISQLDVSVDESEIRFLANQLWLDAGSPEGEGTSFWLNAESQLLAEKRGQIAKSILNQVLMPVMQESAASIQDEAQKYAQSAITVLQKELLENQQLVLPEGVRFHKRVGRIDYLVIEQQPMVRTVLVDTSYHKGKIGGSRYPDASLPKKEYRIALPYVVYQITLSDYQLAKFYIAFRTEPLKTLKDKLSLCVLPNSHEEGSVCCPFTRHNYTNIVDAVNHIIGFYWQSQYRYCLHHKFPDDPAFKTWESWEKASEENPLFVLQLAWPELHFTLARFLGDVAKETPPAPPAGFQDVSSKFIQAATNILSFKELPKPVPAMAEASSSQFDEYDDDAEDLEYDDDDVDEDGRNRPH
jgi:hypothetical protein